MATSGRLARALAICLLSTLITSSAAGSSAGAAGAANRPGRRLLQRQPWFDTSKTVDQRVEALLNSMTLAQMKVQMESTDAGAIPSLGVSAFKYQRECLHGMVGMMASVDDVADVAALPHSLSSAAQAALPQSPRAAGTLERSAAREFELHMPLPLKPISPHVSISDGTPAPALPAQDTPAQAPASTADPELDLPSHARRLLVCGFAINACPFQALLQPSRPDAVFMQLADVAADVGAERLLSALHFGALPVGLALWGAQAWGCLHSAASQAQQPALALA